MLTVGSFSIIQVGDLVFFVLHSRPTYTDQNLWHFLVFSDIFLRLDVSSSPLSCVYHDHVQKLVATDGRHLGARRDLEGVIFLPSLLQPRCANSEEVTIEIPASKVG